MTTGEKVAFVKGLVEGADLKLGENEKKVLDNVLEILGICQRMYPPCSTTWTSFKQLSDDMTRRSITWRLVLTTRMMTMINATATRIPHCTKSKQQTASE